MGAPKGNTNALKHGLYAKHFSPDEKAGLRGMSSDDYRHEINLMRVSVERLFGIQTQLNEMIADFLSVGQPCDVEAMAKISNSLSIAVTALNTAACTHALFNGADHNVNDAFDEALNSLSVIIDDKYLIESQADKEDLQEILVDE
jgi:hypothetical protein